MRVLAIAEIKITLLGGLDFGCIEEGVDAFRKEVVGYEDFDHGVEETFQGRGRDAADRGGDKLRAVWSSNLIRWRGLNHLAIFLFFIRSICSRLAEAPGGGALSDLTAIEDFMDAAYR